MDRYQQIENLLSKGVESILPNKDFLKSRLEKGDPLTIYCGYDPSTPTLHIGHAITLRKLRHFQDLGHRIIFLVGDFTARIGDPTDKSATRTQLSEHEVKKNMKLYKQQASKFIRFSGKNSASIKFNSKWLKKLNFSDTITLSSMVTVDQILKRDMFVRRSEENKPIYLHEFLYPLMQGYDSVAMAVDGEVGGNDQLFNMMMGRTLLKNIKNKEKFVLTTKLLTDSEGKKMSKTEGNTINLSDTPEEIYGKVMSWQDSLILNGFELCTDYTIDQIKSIEGRILGGENPRNIKMELALEVTKACVSEKEAQKAQESFVKKFQERETTDTIPEVLTKGRTFENVCLEEGLVKSKGELQRLIEQNAVTNFITKEKMTSEKSRAISTPGTYKIGKHRFIKII